MFITGLKDAVFVTYISFLLTVPRLKIPWDALSFLETPLNSVGDHPKQSGEQKLRIYATSTSPRREEAKISKREITKASFSGLVLFHLFKDIHL